MRSVSLCFYYVLMSLGLPRHHVFTQALVPLTSVKRRDQPRTGQERVRRRAKKAGLATWDVVLADLMSEKHQEPEARGPARARPAC